MCVYNVYVYGTLAEPVHLQYMWVYNVEGSSLWCACVCCARAREPARPDLKKCDAVDVLDVIRAWGLRFRV
jgi:hypothetical protein